MTKGAALQQFFGQFMTAYASNAVPDDAVLPYLTYDAVFDAWGGGAVSLTLELSDALGIGGVTLPVDGGLIWLKRGSPFCQSLADDTDKNLKRRYINVTAEFLCLN